MALFPKQSPSSQPVQLSDMAPPRFGFRAARQQRPDALEGREAADDEVDGMNHIGLWIEILVNPTRLSTTSDVLADRADPGTDVRLQELTHLFRAIEDLSQQKPGTIWIRCEKTDHLLHERVELTFARSGGHQETRNPLAPVRQELKEHAPSQLLFGGKVVEQ